MEPQLSAFNGTLAKIENSYLYSVIDGNEIRTIRLTKNDYERLIERSKREFIPRKNTLWNRIKLAFKILFKK